MTRSLLIMLVLSAFACQEVEFTDGETEKAWAEICGVNNPMKELSWLKDMVDEQKANPESDYCQLYRVVRGTYQNEKVFVVQVSGALCCTCAGNAVYNCEGEMVFVCEPEKEKKIRDQKEIWSKAG